MNCVSNIAVVSWNTSAGAEFYTATLTQKDGQTQNCWSESNQCGMSGVPCGQNYSVTVVASNRKCSSDPIEGDTLQSGETFKNNSSSTLLLINVLYSSRMRFRSVNRSIMYLRTVKVWTERKHFKTFDWYCNCSFDY